LSGAAIPGSGAPSGGLPDRPGHWLRNCPPYTLDLRRFSRREAPVRPVLALIVLILNIAALTSVLGARTGAGRKLGWTAAVVLLPFAGAAGWLAARRNAAGRSRTN
jgi:hypothetical protein